MKHIGQALMGLVLAFGVNASRASAADAPSPPGAAESLWQLSVQGRWFTGWGEAKGAVAEAEGLGAEAGYGLRLERRLGDWWSVGLGLSTSAWRVKPGGATGVLESGSFLDAAALLKFEPLEFEIPGGPLAFYATGSGGPTLSGDTVFVREPASTEAETFETVRFDAGYHAGASLGASYRPLEALSLFIEAGLDWHYAVHARRSVDLDAASRAMPLPPAYVERLWLGQSVVAFGLAYHF